MRKSTHVAVSTVLALVAATAPLAGLGAQTTTMTFAGQGPANYTPIAVDYGSTATLAVTNHTVTGFGNTPVVTTCGGADHTVEYWGPGYGSFPQVAFQCGNGTVAQYFFQPTAGNEVFLESLSLGSYPSNGVIGPARNYTVNVYDASWTSLFSTSGIITADVTLMPGVSDTQGLYLQIGTDWDVGVGSITTTVRPSAVSAVPEPATYAMLAPGLLGVLALRRRRRA